MQKLSKKGAEFKLVVLGEEFSNEEPCFTRARDLLKKHILQFGHVKSFTEYANWLWRANILPVTSNQDFFGASIIEAVYCKNIPLLPNRLTYPELFNHENNHQYFYKSSDDLLVMLENIINDLNILNYQNLDHIASQFDWGNIVNSYDTTFAKII